MKSERTLLPAVTALLLLGSVSAGQSRSGKVFARYDKPLRSATLDLGTGTITRGPVVVDRAAATVVDFANGDASGFSGVDTGGGFCEWFDSGVKGFTGNASDMVNSFVFAYCSSALAVSSGGPGGSVRLGFYEGYMTFGGAPTTTVALFTLAGLPGNSASSSFFGGFTCRFLRVVFPSLVCFADGPIGYSWRFLDNGTGMINPQGATLAATWPFLACVVSCSGTYLQVDGQGMTDVMDQYCPPGNLRSTFTFGTTSGSFTSMVMEIEEAVDVAATKVGYNDPVSPNPDELLASPMIIGGTFTAAVKLGLGRNKGPFLWDLRLGSADQVPGTPMPGPPWVWGLPKKGKMRLVAAPWLKEPFLGTHSGVSGSVTSTYSKPIPKSLSLVCNEWYAQAVVYGGIGTGSASLFGMQKLSSAVKGVIGTY